MSGADSSEVQLLSHCVYFKIIINLEQSEWNGTKNSTNFVGLCFPFDQKELDPSLRALKRSFVAVGNKHTQFYYISCKREARSFFLSDPHTFPCLTILNNFKQPYILIYLLF